MRALATILLVSLASNAFATSLDGLEDNRRLTYFIAPTFEDVVITTAPNGAGTWNESSTVNGNSSQNSFFDYDGVRQYLPGEKMIYGSGSASGGPGSPAHGYVSSVYDGIFMMIRDPGGDYLVDVILRGTLYCSDVYGIYEGAELHLYHVLGESSEELVYSAVCDNTGPVEFSTNLTLETSFYGVYRIYAYAWGGNDDEDGVSPSHSWEFELLKSPVDVSIDVLPGDEANKIYPNKTGKFPVAVLSSPTFDATQVDSSTVKFGLGEASPANAPIISDVDGLHGSDTTLKFRTEDAGILCNDTEVSLSGETYAGEVFTGTDTIDASDCVTGGCHPY